MSRPIKIAIWSIAAIFFLGLSLWFLSLWTLTRDSESIVETREFSAEELSQSMKHLDPSIRVIDGFEASSHGGWHGDGGSVVIYHVAPNGTDGLIAGLKRFHEEKRKEWPQDHDYEWSESTQPDLSSLESLIPERFQPGPGVYLIGRLRNGSHTISIERQKGYVCFANSRL
jgi:hypothetical protein